MTRKKYRPSAVHIKISATNVLAKHSFQKYRFFTSASQFKKTNIFLKSKWAIPFATLLLRVALQDCHLLFLSNSTFGNKIRKCYPLKCTLWNLKWASQEPKNSVGERDGQLRDLSIIFLYFSRLHSTERGSHWTKWMHH